MFPKIPNVIVNTGMNPKKAWEIAWELRKRKIRVIALSSMIEGYGTYYDYMMAEIDLQEPLMISCSDKAKQRHLNHFYRTVGPCIVNIALTSEEEARTKNFKNSKMIKYNFPMLNMTRDQCLKLCHAHELYPSKTGCVLCPKR